MTLQSESLEILAELRANAVVFQGQGDKSLQQAQRVAGGIPDSLDGLGYHSLPSGKSQHGVSHPQLSSPTQLLFLQDLDDFVGNDEPSYLNEIGRGLPPAQASQ